MLPTDAKERKNFPIGTGVIDYFPDALAAVAQVSKVGNDQHNPGQSLRWDRSKSTDEADAMMRHFVERGKIDIDGTRHSAKMVWRALALLQKEIEAEQQAGCSEKTQQALQGINAEELKRAADKLDPAYTEKRPRELTLDGLKLDTLYLTDVEYKQTCEKIWQAAEDARRRDTIGRVS